MGWTAADFRETAAIHERFAATLSWSRAVADHHHAALANYALADWTDHVASRPRPSLTVNKMTAFLAAARETA